MILKYKMIYMSYQMRVKLEMNFKELFTMNMQNIKLSRKLTKICKDVFFPMNSKTERPNSNKNNNSSMSTNISTLWPTYIK